MEMMMILVNDILSALNDKLIMGGIFCDLAKAFVLIMISYYQN
jgi:hypothetical protein